MEPECREMELASGRKITCRSDAEARDEVTIRGAEGEVLLEVVVTPEGPVLRFRAAQVQLDCQGAIQVRCERFEVESAGDIKLAAQRGNVDLHANDDVNLNGERVRLNC